MIEISGTNESCQLAICPIHDALYECLEFPNVGSSYVADWRSFRIFWVLKKASRTTHTSNITGCDWSPRTALHIHDGVPFRTPPLFNRHNHSEILHRSLFCVSVWQRFVYQAMARDSLGIFWSVCRHVFWQETNIQRQQQKIRIKKIDWR